ncbi:uroporphyrinogen-III synthase [Salegentibacter flavus]|uniref:Uroporphyrinogen-III synthase n=1 Tax=Salegentibacter flavus TaxID=287099 RepID=A0A1I4ZZ31_9FLAO|nr:uroporphyrinogen-III synthase [Salegentibacter flavus]SFN55426.1 uroporphyrinogen-III synthase [Salegentibacter flavus]
MTVLSTKKLSLSQKNLFLNTGLSLVEYDAINIEFLDFEFPEKEIKNAIITSRSSAKAIIERQLKIQNCFCVGEKTAGFLKKHNFNIREVSDYGSDLAKIITEKYREDNFTFFCGNLRREELPSVLKEEGIEFQEVEVYKTSLNKQSFPQEFDGIMFYSPSGVKSFASENKIKESTAFCIGKTTAKEAEKHTENIIIATKPSIENLIVTVVKHYTQKNLK